MELKFLWLTNFCTSHWSGFQFPVFLWGSPPLQCSVNPFFPGFLSGLLLFSVTRFLGELIIHFYFFNHCWPWLLDQHSTVFSSVCSLITHYHGLHSLLANLRLLSEMARSLKAICFGRGGIWKMNAWLLAMLAMQYEVICEGSEAESYHVGQITKVRNLPAVYQFTQAGAQALSPSLLPFLLCLPLTVIPMRRSS